MHTFRTVVNASSVDTIEMSKAGVPNSKLSKHRLGDSMIDNAHYVATCLSGVPQNLKGIRSWGDSAVKIASVSVTDAKNQNVQLCTHK
jgi:hypothetical protein